MTRMKKLSFILLALAAGALYAFKINDWDTSPADQTKTIVIAANDFLNLLSAEQRKTTQFEFLRPKTATRTQFNMANMRGGPGGPPNGRRTGGDTSRRPNNRNGQRPGGGNGRQP